MQSFTEYQYLGHVNSPQELKALDNQQLLCLNAEIRDFLIRRVNENGGHLASNLGVVELTVALHRVFDSPKDHMIWDVGHQCYVHKILTGRLDQFETLRKGGGLSGFTKRSESEHDPFGAGHSSTSISAALGFAMTDKLSGSDAYSIAVIGDGAFTGGMVHEALNNVDKNLRLVIVLNENEMSIAKNTGRIANTLAHIRRGKAYFDAKKVTRNVLKGIPLVGKHLFRVVKRVKMGVKNALYGSNYFEDMGLTYLGPVDGNDMEAIETLLREAKKLDESVIIHVKTKKGLGYQPAEQAPTAYHGVSPTGKSSEKPSFSKITGKVLTELAAENDRICAITAAMGDGTGLETFHKAYPERYFDVGIAEEHAVTFGAAMAANGYIPVFAVYSTFLQRAYDQIIHDAALQNLPLVMCIDRAGISPSDGATHHGIFDVAFLSHIPGVKIHTPVTADGLALSIKTAISEKCPVAIRYPNGREHDDVLSRFYKDGAYTDIDVRAWNTEDAQCLIVTHGKIVREAIKAVEALAGQGIRAGILLCEYIKPYDKLANRVTELIGNSDTPIVFLEEEIRAGGFGMMLSDTMARNGILPKHAIMAIDDNFVHQTRDESVYTTAGLDAQCIERTVKTLIE
ncbi:MAG: 1-deoxy-D-xylulose-5-phosphate synthase [Ruminococcaceae bacterium]|nr:1-deoxy-D-xylulose-5-phosphate synthase [Oscillospiraceae bacterium]